MPQSDLIGNDATVAKAYSLMAINGKAQVWAKFAEAEIQAIIEHLSLVPSKNKDDVDVLDVGCGTGRHSLAFAMRGFKVRGYDFVDSWVERARTEVNRLRDQIVAATGSASFDWADARNMPPMQAAQVVLCLYDVLGSSDLPDDAQNLMDTLYRLSMPGGAVVLTAMNGIQMLRGLPSTAFSVQDPNDRELIEAVNTMQRSGEVFEFAKMHYNGVDGALVRRERFMDGSSTCQDELIRERRFIPAEVVKMGENSGFTLQTMTAVRAGKWDLANPSLDPNAPEIAFVFRRPQAGPMSYPRHRRAAVAKKSFGVEVIPREEITAQHAAIVSRIFCADFGTNPKTKKPHVLGPVRMMRRLQKCSYLCLAFSGKSPVGYMFGTEYDQLYTTIAWLDSICVVRDFRRRGMATAMLDMFARQVPKFEWLGATSPNPITRLVLNKLQIGTIFGPGTDPAPENVLEGLMTIASKVEDLKNCEIDTKAMRIKTKFTVSIGEKDRRWAGTGSSEPAWWTQLANLPEDWEALLLIHRDARDQLETPR